MIRKTSWPSFHLFNSDLWFRLFRLNSVGIDSGYPHEKLHYVQFPLSWGSLAFDIIVLESFFLLISIAAAKSKNASCLEAQYLFCVILSGLEIKFVFWFSIERCRLSMTAFLGKLCWFRRQHRQINRSRAISARKFYSFFLNRRYYFVKYWRLSVL